MACFVRANEVPVSRREEVRKRGGKSARRAWTVRRAVRRAVKSQLWTVKRSFPGSEEVKSRGRPRQLEGQSKEAAPPKKRSCPLVCRDAIATSLGA